MSFKGLGWKLQRCFLTSNFLSDVSPTSCAVCLVRATVALAADALAASSRLTTVRNSLQLGPLFYPYQCHLLRLTTYSNAALLINSTSTFQRRPQNTHLQEKQKSVFCFFFIFVKSLSVFNHLLLPKALEIVNNGKSHVPPLSVKVSSIGWKTNAAAG